MARRKVSVFIMTYNEEAKIRDCLESVRWADEIVVIDSFSTDRTVEICREYTDRIFQKEFNGFGELRNFSVSKTSHDWILSIDADERATEELKQEVLAKLEAGPDADVYFVPRINYLLGRRVRHCGWYPDYRQPQFFRKGAMTYTDHLVHEGYIANGTVSYLKGHAIQIPFLSLDQFFRKMDRYSTLRAEDLARRGTRFGVHQLILNPLAMFSKTYIFKLGFLDGAVGLVISLLYAYYTFVKYVKLWEKNMTEGKSDTP
ncbi:MAG: glycosyltransferase family 2 protein [Thermodesulfovibrionales bacterium]